MIKEQDLQEAIAECQGAKNPNANTCLKLAAYYTIQDHLFKEDDPRPYPSRVPIGEQVFAQSFSSGKPQYNSDSEFSRIIKDKSIDDVLSVMDELMETLNVINPRLYEGVMAKLLY